MNVAYLFDSGHANLFSPEEGAAMDAAPYAVSCESFDVLDAFTPCY